MQKHASQILRKMLEQEEAELQVGILTQKKPFKCFKVTTFAPLSCLFLQGLMEEWLKSPSPSLEERIESAKRRAHQVRVKIQNQVSRKRSSIKIKRESFSNK